MANYDSNGFSPDKNTRIVYVDPNDIYGYVNGVALTPDYTDYCIWCNLIVEKYSRIKNDASGQAFGTLETYTVSWDASKPEGTTHLSFMRGRDTYNYNYITTDYTNIDFNTVKQRNIVEGLGIESINVAMNNYYIPEITINFIDVRGSGFFGREEATHNSFELTSLDKDEYGNEIDNFYSCFVSFPYPRFRLQIKGFYGRPVTYQLCCSKFTGSFDSDTGNFKITAKFIGYQYSILADVPFMYIVAAPYCKYVGKSYWDNHAHSEDWQLSDGKEPVTLYEFYQNIRRSITDDKAKTELMAYTEQKKVESEISVKNNLEMLRSYFTSLIVALKESGKFEYVFDTFDSTDIKDEATNPEQQIILIKRGQSETDLTSRVCKAYHTFITTLDDFETKTNITYPSGQKYRINKSLRPNYGEDSWEPGKIALTKFLTYKNGVPYVINNANNYPLSNPKSSFKVKVSAVASGGSNGTIAISRALSEKISKHAKSLSGKDNETWYACIIDCKGFMEVYYDIVYRLNEYIKASKDLLEKKQELNIVNFFHFAPYVGNFFKIIMCHLETFVHIMYGVAGNIDLHKNERTPMNLGISYGEMDLRSSYTSVPPFPAIYKSRIEPNDKRYENLENAVDTRGWVGDVIGAVEWEEKKMIDELYNALSFVSDAKTEDVLDSHSSEYKKASIIDNVFPIIPSDLFSGVPKYAYNSFEKLAAYLGIRSMQLLSLFNRGNSVDSSIANKFGCLDAYNFYKNESSLSLLTGLVGDEEKTNDFVDNVIKTITCYNDGSNTRYSFEFVNTDDKGRQPIFVVDGNKLVYKYMETSDGIPIIPYNVSDLSFSGISERYIPSGDANGHIFYCTVNDENNRVFIGNDTQYTGGSARFIDSATNEAGGTTSIKENYVNSSLFYVVYNEDEIEKIDNMFAKVNDSGQNDDEQFKVLKENAKKYTDIAKKYWVNVDVDEDEFYDMNRVVAETRYLEKDKYLKYSGKSSEYEDYIYNIKVNTNPFDGTYYGAYVNGNPPQTNQEDEYFTTNGIPIKVDKKDGKKKIKVLIKNRVYINANCVMNDCLPLFGTAFYYLQNGKTKITDYLNPDAGHFINPIDDKVKKVKILLLLHTYQFNYDKLKSSSFFNNNSKSNGGIEKVPLLYLLFIGGLIWRKRYVEKNGDDPINYGDIYKRPSSNIDPLLYKSNGSYYFVCTDKPISYNVSYSDIVNSNMDIHCENYLMKMFEDYVNAVYDGIEESSELHVTETVDTTPNMPSATHSEEEVNRHLYYDDVREISLLGPDDFENFVLNGNSEKHYRISDLEKYYCIYRQGYGAGFYACTLYNKEYEEYLNNERRKKCYVLTSGSPDKNFKAYNSVSMGLVEQYLTGFITTLYRFMDIGSKKALASRVVIDEVAMQERDFKVGIYMYLKNLWDKWLCGYYYSHSDFEKERNVKYELKDTFDVKNYFLNFMFVDSFYRNIFKRLKLNCEVLLDSVNGATKDFNLYSYLGTIVSKHQCMFISIPDYVNLGDDNSAVATDNMRDMFRPLPANATPMPQIDNKFIVMYTHQPSSIATVDKTDFKPDYFDIWSEHDGTNVVPDVFKRTEPDGEPYFTDLQKQINRYGYNVPAFGVTYSRQANSIFKNIKASMDNPVMTEQAILAMGDIAEMGNSTKKKVVFYGQDIYPIYSNYSFTIELDMMGDAQIQPLMYFQLMNIPMFRGTYMIIAVTHSISQGNMTTHIKATKMSKYATPFVSNWYTVSPNTNDKSLDGWSATSVNLNSGCNEKGQNMANELKEMVKHPLGSGNEVDMNRTKSPDKPTDKCAAYVTRAIKRGGLPNFQNALSAANGEYEKSLKQAGFKPVVENIATSNIHEIVDNARPGDVAVFQPVQGGSKYGHVEMCVGNKNGKDREGFITEWYSDFKQPNFWPNQLYRDSWARDDSYVRIYRYSEACSVNLNETEFREVKLDGTQREANMLKLMKYFTEDVSKESFWNGNNLSKHQAAAICGNIFQESRYSPYSVEPGKSGRGLIQWSHSSRRHLNGYDLAGQYGNNIENMMKGDNDTCLYAQARYCAWEMKKRNFGLFKQDSIFNKTVSNDNILNTSILDGMTEAFCDKFENPDTELSEIEARRIAARNAYEKYMVHLRR